MSLRARLNLPKEHGAWVMVYAPLLLGWLVAGAPWHWRMALLVSAVSALFISRESLLLWGRARRRNRMTEKANRAGRLLVAYGVIALLAGVPLLWREARWGLLPLGLLGGGLLLWNGWQATEFAERGVVSELLAIVGLTMTAPAAYYVATRATLIVAWPLMGWLWLLCALYFASSVFYVKLRVSALHAKTITERQQARRQCLRYHGLLLLMLIALVMTRALPALLLLAYAPILLRTLRSLCWPETTLNLKHIGMAEIVYTLVFLVVTTIALRTLA